MPWGWGFASILKIRALVIVGFLIVSGLDRRLETLWVENGRAWLYRSNGSVLVRRDVGRSGAACYAAACE